jgi:hypothetical protein
VVENGRESRAVTPGLNATSEAVEESVGPGAPVLQLASRPSSFHQQSNPVLDFYTRWEAPPNSAVESLPVDYLVAVPENCPKPAPCGLHLAGLGNGEMGGYGWWQYYDGGSILVASNPVPMDGWSGHHEKFWAYSRRPAPDPGRQAAFTAGDVKPYTQNRLVSFLDWAGPRYDIDRSRMFVTGSAEGGSGAVMLAIARPEEFAFCNSWVGGYSPAAASWFKPSYERAYGREDWGTEAEDGSSPWSYFDDSERLLKDPAVEVPLLILANGKDDRDAGWPQAAILAEVLQITRQPHIFSWSMQGQAARTRLPISLSDAPPMMLNLKSDQSLPAFTRCSLDDNYGSGAELSPPRRFELRPGRFKTDFYDGDHEGQLNQYLFWETADIVDESGRWEMTIGLIPQAPKDDCAVDVTPRRTRKFNPSPGIMVDWVNLSGGREVQRGQAVVDEYGLVTIPKVSVGKGGNRLVLTTPFRIW